MPAPRLLSGVNGRSGIGADCRGSVHFETQPSIANDPKALIDAYTRVDAQVGTTFMDGRASLTPLGRNLLDKSFVEAIVDTPIDTNGYSQFLTLEAERTWGLRFSVCY